MALFRCNKCGHLREVANEYIDKSVKCPKCKQAAPIHDTVAFVENVIGKYGSKNRELNKLKQKLAEAEIDEPLANDEQYLETVDIYNTTALTQQGQYTAIIDWFQERQIQVEVNQKAVDTTGFFDEVALSLGNQYDLLKEVTDKIKHIQRKGYTNVKLQLSQKNVKQIDEITKFCQELYDYSFVAKYFYQKKEKIVRLTLQISTEVLS